MDRVVVDTFHKLFVFVYEMKKKNNKKDGTQIWSVDTLWRYFEEGNKSVAMHLLNVISCVKCFRI